MNSRILAAGIGVLSLAVVAGCGGGSSGGGTDAGSPVTVNTPKPHTHTPKPPTTPSVTVTPSPTTTVTVTGPPPATGTPRCTSAHLALSLGDSQGAAGTSYTPIVLTNTGSSKCELHGYPGVSFVNASGTQLGKPSREDDGTVATVKIGSGASANALLRQPNPGNFDPGACNVTTADRLKVFPPGETEPLFIKDAVPVCTTSAGRTGVAPMAAGSGS